MEKFVKAILNDDYLWFELEDGEQEQFLKYAKHLGCTWQDGTPINIETDSCAVHMAICQVGMTISNIPFFIWMSNSESYTRVKFSEFMAEDPAPLN